MRLSDYGWDRYSQTGEDGAVCEIFRRIGEGNRLCVEFGAGNGVDGANTALLWRHQGWRAVLIESDTALAHAASQTAAGRPVTVLHAAVSVTDPELSIDALLDRAGVRDRIDFMSVDIDGDDFWVVTSMKARPRVLCVEFNPTVPPHLDLLPAGPGNRYGVGSATLKRALETRGYRMVGLCGANMFAVSTDEADCFDDLETDLEVLQPAERFAYVTTDQMGRPVFAGVCPEWGLVWPPSDTEFTANQTGLIEMGLGESVSWRDRMLNQIELLSQQVHTEVDGVHRVVESTRRMVEKLQP